MSDNQNSIKVLDKDGLSKFWQKICEAFALKSHDHNSKYALRTTPPNDEIWYTSSDGNIVTPNNLSAFGAIGVNIVSNTYSDGKGVIKFDGNVTSIIEHAFTGCASLLSITIPDCVTGIETHAFTGCASLLSITIPDSVTSIGYAAFSYCTSLLSITIPDSVTSIGEKAFYNCSKLVSVYCKPMTPPTLGPNIFRDNASDREICVPMECVDAYKAASGWSSYVDDIVGCVFEDEPILVLSDVDIEHIISDYFQLSFIGSGSGSGFDGISEALVDEAGESTETTDST